MYRVKIGREFIKFEFVFDSMEEASVFIEACLRNNKEEEFSCVITLVSEDEGEDDRE